MVPRDLNICFQGLAFFKGQIYNPVTLGSLAEWRDDHKEKECVSPSG